MEKSLINNQKPVVTHEQSAIMANPGESSFNHPTSFVSAQFAAVLSRFLFTIAAMRTDKFNSLVLQSLPQRIRISRRVINQTFNMLSLLTRNLNKGLFNQRNFMRSRRVQPASQRKTLAVDHHHPLRAFAPFGFSDGKTPFFAEAKLPSIKHSLQSILPWSSNWAKNCRQMVNHRSSSSQSFNRLQHVLGLGYSSGKSCHRAPVLRTHKMPSNTLRLSRHGRPPFLLCFNFGNNGSIFTHCLSVNSGFRFLAIGFHLRPLFIHIWHGYRQNFYNFLRFNPNFGVMK